MSAPDISVIIAAFNAAPHLDRCISSILQNTGVREVIVVDDGSTDETAVVAQRWGSPVRIVRQDNQGPGAARNVGARRALGQYLYFLDADDEMLAEGLTHLYASLESHPESGVASGAHIYHCSRRTERRPALGEIRTEGPGLLVDFFETARRFNVACVGSVLVRRDMFLKVGGFREDRRFGEDLFLWGRLAGVSTWHYVDTPVFRYNHSVTTSATLRVPEAEKPSDWLFSESDLERWVRPTLWPSYRRYRRDLLLRQARSALYQGSTSKARSLLRRISPAPFTLPWLATLVLCSLGPVGTWLLRAQGRLREGGT